MLAFAGTSGARADDDHLLAYDEVADGWTADDYIAAVAASAARKAAVSYKVPNPYVMGGNTDDIVIGRLVVFGDSYSRLKRRPFLNWAEQLKADGDVGTLQGFAVSGATAANLPVGGRRKTFAQQISRWLAGPPTFGRPHATAVYFGYNDISAVGQTGFNTLGRSKTEYDRRIKSLIANGANTGDRHIFVFQVHDWGKNPQQGGDPKGVFRARTIEWNRFVAKTANTYDRLVAVDMFTAIDRVVANPDLYGLDDVTTVDPHVAGDKKVYLFDDANHFSFRGQQIINQVFRHYLVRGWDWANTLTVGSATARRLAADIDNGLVFGSAALVGQEQLGLTAFPIGALAESEPLTEGRPAVDIARASFAQAWHPDERPDGGLAVNYALSPATGLGVVIGQYDETREAGQDLASTTSRARSDSLSMYLTHKAASLDLRTRVAVSDDRHSRSEHDELIGSTSRAGFGGRTTEVAQRAGYVVEVGWATLTPWLELTHRVQEVDGFTIQNPYISDVSYSSARAAETLAGIGLNLRSAPIAMGEAGLLRLSAGVSYTQSLRRDDYKVSITEAASVGPAHQETIERPDLREIGVSLGGEMAMGERLALGAGIGVAHDPELGSRQEAMLRLNYRF